MELYNDRIDKIIMKLKNDLDNKIELIIAGSTYKKTNIKGISDIDLLMVLPNGFNESQEPRGVLRIVRKLLKQRYPNTVVRSGDRSISLCFNDITLQIVPVFKKDNKFVLPANSYDWTKPTNQHHFTDMLNSVCKKFGKNNDGIDRAIAVIKVMKNIESKKPKHLRITGYHIEQIVVETLRNLDDDRKDVSYLLNECLSAASKQVLTKTKECSGQTDYVDQDHGSSYSHHRYLMSESFLSVKK